MPILGVGLVILMEYGQDGAWNHGCKLIVALVLQWQLSLILDLIVSSTLCEFENAYIRRKLL